MVREHATPRIYPGMQGLNPEQNEHSEEEKMEWGNLLGREASLYRAISARVGDCCEGQRKKTRKNVFDINPLFVISRQFHPNGFASAISRFGRANHNSVPIQHGFLLPAEPLTCNSMIKSPSRHSFQQLLPRSR